MVIEEINKVDPLINREKQFLQRHLRNYPLLNNWGIFAEEIGKPLIISTLATEGLYEKFYARSTIAVTSQIEPLLIWLLEQGVLIPQPLRVRNYLFRYFDLTRILRPVCKVIMDRISMNIQLTLELYCDPEIKDEYLVLYLRQNGYSEYILKFIEELRSEYEIDLADSSGWFLVTTDFQPPVLG